MLTREPQMQWDSWTDTVDRSARCEASETLYGQLILLALFALAALIQLTL